MTQPDVCVPQQTKAQTGRGAHHPYTNLSADRRNPKHEVVTMVLVFVDPAIALFGLDHEFVITKPSVDEGIDESARQIPPG